MIFKAAEMSSSRASDPSGLRRGKETGNLSSSGGGSFFLLSSSSTITALDATTNPRPTSEGCSLECEFLLELRTILLHCLLAFG